MRSVVESCDFDVSNATSPCFHFSCVAAAGGVGRSATAEEVRDCALFTGTYCRALPEASLSVNPGCYPLAGARSNCSYSLDAAAARSPCHAVECVEGTSAQCALYVADYCSGVGAALPACNVPDPAGGKGLCTFNATIASSPCVSSACVRDKKSRHMLAAPVLMQV